MPRILVTGGAGFIGSNFVFYLLGEEADTEVVVLDKLTYAGDLGNLDPDGDEDIERRLTFIQGDVCDFDVVVEAARGCDGIINFAAETHVDVSLVSANDFIDTNIKGTYTLLEATKKLGVPRFLQVSTDEVYGQKTEGASIETDRLSPRNPYSASKAGAELMIRAHRESYGTPALIIRGSNAYGPLQHPEKMIPRFITRALCNLPLPVYGDGQQIREWLYADDFCSAIHTVFSKGNIGEVYNAGGGVLKRNIEVAEAILGLLDKPLSLIEHVPDRPGHDVRYCLSSEKLKRLGWEPSDSFEESLEHTVYWYEFNLEWWADKVDFPLEGNSPIPNSVTR